MHQPHIGNINEWRKNAQPLRVRTDQMLARRLHRDTPLRLPHGMLLLAIAAELAAAGYVFYDGLMSIVTSLL